MAAESAHARPLVGNWTSPRSLSPSVRKTAGRRLAARKPVRKVTATAMPEEETTAALRVSFIGGRTICG